MEDRNEVWTDHLYIHRYAVHNFFQLLMICEWEQSTHCAIKRFQVCFIEYYYFKKKINCFWLTNKKIYDILWATQDRLLKANRSDASHYLVAFIFFWPIASLGIIINDYLTMETLF